VSQSLLALDSERPPAREDWHPSLRYYQREAVEAIERELTESRSTLAVMATGLGKTQVFCEVARRWHGTVLVLAHRTELVQQARDRLEGMLGEEVGIEQQDQRCHYHHRVVVGSIDSVRTKGRLHRLGQDRFDLVICDEAHHYIAPTWRRALDHFGGAKLLGVTATPDRGDEKALGRLFESVAYVYDIVQGIDAGYLVPVEGRRVVVSSIDVSNMRKVAGDLPKGELDVVMATSAGAVAAKTLEICDTRQGIVFLPGVESARLTAEAFNDARPGCAAMVSGDTPEAERADIVSRFRAERIQFLCNCMVATEGFDAPTASAVIIARPTLSRALYAQMAGRGLRVLPGVVDGFGGPELAATRRELIASSQKPNCLLIDFVGNSGKHSLMGPVDLLGGDYSDEEQEAAKTALSKAKDARDVRVALAESRLALQAARKARALSHTVTAFNAFDLCGVKPSDELRYARYGTTRPTDKQRDCLLKMGLHADAVGQLDRRQASKALDNLFKRRKSGLATLKQMTWLAKHGITDPTITFTQASRALDFIFSMPRGKRVDPALIMRVITQ